MLEPIKPFEYTKAKREYPKLLKLFNLGMIAYLLYTGWAVFQLVLNSEAGLATVDWGSAWTLVKSNLGDLMLLAGAAILWELWTTIDNTRTYLRFSRNYREYLQGLPLDTLLQHAHSGALADDVRWRVFNFLGSEYPGWSLVEPEQLLRNPRAGIERAQAMLDNRAFLYELGYSLELREQLRSIVKRADVEDVAPEEQKGLQRLWSSVQRWCRRFMQME